MTLHALQNGHLGFSKFQAFDPQKSKSRFFTENANKIENVEDIKKTECIL